MEQINVELMRIAGITESDVAWSNIYAYYMNPRNEPEYASAFTNALLELCGLNHSDVLPNDNYSVNTCRHGSRYNGVHYLRHEPYGKYYEILWNVFHYFVPLNLRLIGGHHPYHICMRADAERKSRRKHRRLSDPYIA